MKRFSKMVSVITLVPSARPSSVIIWACMSVAKPGNGLVTTSVGRGRPSRWTRMRSVPTSSRAPAASSLSSTAARWSGTTSRTVTSPPVIAPATRNVPASTRSGMIRCRAPPSSRTPSISIRSVPAPRIFAPMALSSRARSKTSGSRAAFSRIVVPSASAAAIMRFSVPVTVTRSKTIRVPFSRAARAST